ncbi:hypothetical protein GGR26_002745 [Lewinella marina]|uniref:Uncharacterized protein n=1 Tax=Neolewinella marina TaxID=438751 RepID=A0A2G0CCY5_9BACT|nr:hypothetical protein [Neolewinella marina]NJB86968.1 hypothetical protein [Neolewinella marina]PHK97836.1 hypothetical protein CGL56_13560 [Neolewinella marina]
MLRSTFFLILLVMCALPLSAKKGESLFDRWSRTEGKSIDIYLNLDTLLANRNTTNVMRGTVVDSGLHLGVDIHVRGRFRRRTCALPPILLQFDKDPLVLAGLNTHNDYKLVTPCTDDAAGQDAILRENLVYELYRTIDPEASYRTHLLTITYHNTADGSSFTSYGLVIEDTDELEDRLEASNCEDCYNQPVANYTNAETVALFQYMVGNADYSTSLARNLKLMQAEDGRLTAVPYDFDFCGVVNPTYGRLIHPEQDNMTDRVWVWEFQALPQLDQAASEFALLEDELLAQVEAYTPLSYDSRREIKVYLKDFFRDLKRNRIGR